ncbi:MAG: hypothetical protein QXE30_05865, partial [Candidatus Bathyarchaeia archaeon]
AALMGNLINYNEICSICQTYYKELKRIISILSENIYNRLNSTILRKSYNRIKESSKTILLRFRLKKLCNR